MLDEPTNHLDANTRDALADALAEFEGPLLLVSHDRYLLRSTVDEFWLVDNGVLRPFDGDLDDYAQWLQKERSSKVAADAATQGSAGKGGATTTDSTDGANAAAGGHAGSHPDHHERSGERDGTTTAANMASGSAGSTNRASDRRERAQQRAALAARRKPIEQAIRQIEQQMEQLQARADHIDQALAAPDAFSDRAAATALQRERAQIGTDLEALENDWLEQQERLEAVERE